MNNIKTNHKHVNHVHEPDQFTRQHLTIKPFTFPSTIRSIPNNTHSNIKGTSGQTIKTTPDKTCQSNDPPFSDLVATSLAFETGLPLTITVSNGILNGI